MRANVRLSDCVKRAPVVLGAPEESIEKIESAYKNGCRRFDGSIKGYGGCPMAQNDMVGNISTNELISFFSDEKLTVDISEFNIAVENFENILRGIDL